MDLSAARGPPVHRRGPHRLAPPVRPQRQLAEIPPGVAFVDSFANSSAVDTDDGLVVVDTSGRSPPARCTTRSAHGRAAASTPRSSPTATSTTCSASTSTRRTRAPTAGPRRRVIAHEPIAERFERYRMTAGYNAVINQRQFKAPGLHWPIDYRMPDVTYRDALTITVGGETFELHHDRGETDDSTWVWDPGAQGALHRRPVHLGVAQLRQPAEGAALRARLGDRVPQDDRARARSAAARARAADHRRGPRPASAHRGRRAARVAPRADARADERRRAPRRHRAHRAAPRAPARPPVPPARSTTSRSSSCATSGACTAAGTTAIPRT